MSKVFKILYITNLLIIILSLLSPILEWNTKADTNLELSYFATFIVLSITLCISFIGLNLYGLFKYKIHRKKFLIVTILMGIWIAVGVYQLVYSYVNNIIL